MGGFFVYAKPFQFTKTYEYVGQICPDNQFIILREYISLMQIIFFCVILPLYQMKKHGVTIQMNPLIYIMLLFFIIGILDKIFGGRLGLAQGLDRGLSQMGVLCMSMLGFYCIGVTLIRENIGAISAFGESLPFDLSIISGMLLAPDMGGFPLSVEMAADSKLGLFSGMLLSSGIGCLLSFQLPIALTMIEKEDIPAMMEGMIPGILAVPVGLFVGGFCLGLSVSTLFMQMLPVLIICAIMAVGFWKAHKLMAKILTVFGICIRVLGMVLFALLMVGLFYEPFQMAEEALVYEGLTVVAKITIIVCGALSLSELLMKFCKPLFKKIACKLKTNETSMMGLLISITSGVAMLPMYRSMDEKGKLLNSAFSIMGAYVLGGQMAYIAGVTSGYSVWIYILGKLLSGIVGILLVEVTNRVLQKRQIEQ